jgi:tetratricopeptide (TPR) repeat protein
MRNTKRAIATVILSGCLLAPFQSHAFFFFFIPTGLFSNQDKNAVADYEKKGNWQGMYDLADLRLKNDEKNPGWLYLKGLALQKMYKYEDAIQSYKLALEAKPNYKEAQLNMGIAMLDSQQYDDCIRTLTDLIGKAPEMWAPYYNVGVAYIKKDDPVKARQFLEQLKTRNMVMAERLEESYIKPLETTLEETRVAREKAEKERSERLQAKDQATTDAEAQSKLTQAAQAKPAKGLEEQLKELKQLNAKGLLSKEVYEQRQRDLLKQQ